jgi:glycogen debranching enzyme
MTKIVGHSGSESWIAASKEGRSILERIQPKSASEIIYGFTETPTIDILYGNRFMVSSRKGDMFEEEHGVFANDTRFLSVYKAEINGREPLALTSSNTTHYSAGFYLSNPKLPATRQEKDERIHSEASEEIPRESLANHRMRFIGHDVREEYFVTNVCERKLRFTLSFRVDADFADIFEVKEKVFSEKPDMLERKRKKNGQVREEREIDASSRGRRGLEANQIRHQEEKKGVHKDFLQAENAFDFSYHNQRDRFKARTRVWFSKRGRAEQKKKKRYEYHNV